MEIAFPDVKELLKPTVTHMHVLKNRLFNGLYSDLGSIWFPKSFK